MIVVAFRILVVTGLALAASGCASVAVTLAGLGAGIGANHFIGSVSTRTFTHPQEDTKWATLGALKRMRVDVASIEATSRAGELIKGRTEGREFEIELEPVSATVTRMKSVVRMEGSLTLDGATAAEIVAQTERSLAAQAAALAAPAPVQERMPEAPAVTATTLAATDAARTGDAAVRTRSLAPTATKAPPRPARAPAGAAPQPPRQ
jgi:hypothetical protein